MDELIITSVLLIDKILIITTISLSVITIIYTAIREIFDRLEENNMTRIKQKLRVLAWGGKDILEKTGPVILASLPERQIFQIVKERGAILPAQLNEEFRKSFTDVKKIDKIKHIASYGRNKWMRIEALLTLVFIAPETTLTILKKNIYNKDKNISYFSTLALAQIKTTESAKILLGLLDTPTFSAHKITMLLESFPADILDDVVKKTSDPNPTIRFWAIKLLSKFRTHQRLDIIIHLTKDKNADIRSAACECLGEYGNKEAEEPLRHRLLDNVWFVKMHAVRALNKIFQKDCVTMIGDLLKENEWFLREEVKKVMVEHFKESLPLIVKFMDSDNLTLKKDCTEILENADYIIKIFHNIIEGIPTLRIEDVRLLKKILETGAHLGIEHALETFNEDQHARIIHVLKQIDPQLAEHVEKKIQHLISEA